MDNPLDQKYQRWYTEGAETYDARFQSDFARLQSKLIVDLMQPKAGMTILDVGTGTGRASLALAEASDACVIGLDLTTAMMRRAEAHRDEAGLAWPAFVCANARQLPFAANTFDAVVSIRVLHLFPTPHLGSFVNEMRRVLKPGGTLLVEFNSPFTGVGWVAAREVLRRRDGRKSRHYLWPQHLDALFGGMEDREVHGFWLPGLGRLARLNDRFRPALKLATLPPPVGFLGDKILVRARKAS